jgi:hypothetical protein
MAGAPPWNAGTTCARCIAALQICTSRSRKIACATRTVHPPRERDHIVLVQRAPEVSQEYHERAPCKGLRVGWSFLIAFFARTQKCKRKRRAQQLPGRHPHAAGCNEREARGSGEGGTCGGGFGSRAWAHHSHLHSSVHVVLRVPAVSGFGVVGSRNRRRRSIRPRERRTTSATRRRAGHRATERSPSRSSDRALRKYGRTEQ